VLSIREEQNQDADVIYLDSGQFGAGQLFGMKTCWTC